MPVTVHEIMNELRATEGLRFAILFDQRGTPTAESEPQERALCRSMAIGMGALETVSQHAAQGTPKRALIDQGDTRLLFTALPQGMVLCVLTDDNFNLGLLLNAATQWEERLGQALEGHGEEPTDSRKPA